MTIYQDSKRIVADAADVAVVSNRGSIDFTGGLGNTDADDVAHFESTGQLNKIIGEKIEVNNSLIGQTVTKLQFKLFRMDSGTISDTLTFGVWDFATGDLKANGSFGTVRIDELVYNASSSHSNAQKVTLVHSGSGVTIATNDIIGIRSNVDTMSSKRVEVAQHDDATPDSYANGGRVIFVEGQNDANNSFASGKDIWFQAGTSSGNTIITFTGDGTFTPTSPFNVEYLVVAGGGGADGVVVLELTQVTQLQHKIILLQLVLVVQVVYLMIQVTLQVDQIQYFLQSLQQVEDMVEVMIMLGFL